tara:strand:- start:62170 stop:62667 length:498 start_codon:yes stop_codon:yes gene_type:complete
MESKKKVIKRIKGFRKLKNGWNGYGCNKMSLSAVGTTLMFYEKLCEYFPYNDILPYPTADSGNEHRRPTNSMSSVTLEITKCTDDLHRRNLELDFRFDGIEVWGYSESRIEKEHKFKNVFDFPLEKANSDEVAIIHRFDELMEYLYWLDPSLQSLMREKYIDEII